MTKIPRIQWLRQHSTTFNRMADPKKQQKGKGIERNPELTTSRSEYD
jgi:hypothetical protein